MRGLSDTQVMVLRAAARGEAPDFRGAAQNGGGWQSVVSVVRLGLIVLRPRWDTTTLGRRVLGAIDSGSREHVAGQVRAVTEWRVVCGACGDETGCEGESRTAAERDADAQGWRKLGALGRLCPKCWTDVPKEITR